MIANHENASVPPLISKKGSPERWDSV